jgi:hypothetical protein
MTHTEAETVSDGNVSEEIMVLRKAIAVGEVALEENRCLTRFAKATLARKLPLPHLSGILDRMAAERKPAADKAARYKRALKILGEDD